MGVGEGCRDTKHIQGDHREDRLHERLPDALKSVLQSRKNAGIDEPLQKYGLDHGGSCGDDDADDHGDHVHPVVLINVAEQAAEGAIFLILFFHDHASLLFVWESLTSL